MVKSCGVRTFTDITTSDRIAERRKHFDVLKMIVHVEYAIIHIIV